MPWYQHQCGVWPGRTPTARPPGVAWSFNTAPHKERLFVVYVSRFSADGTDVWVSTGLVGSGGDLDHRVVRLNLRSGDLQACSAPDVTYDWSGYPTATETPLRVDDVVVLARAGELVALDAVDLSRRWTVKAKGFGSTFRPVVADGNVLAAVDSTSARVVRPDGSVAVEVPLSDRVTRVATDGALLVLSTETSRGAAVHCYDIAVRDRRWSVALPGSVRDLAISGDRVVVAAADRWLYCLAGSDGAPHWETRPEVKASNDILVDGTVIVVPGRSATVVVEQATGDRLWTSRHTSRDRICLAGDHLIVGAGRSVRAYDARLGTSLWSRDLLGQHDVSAVAVSGGVALVALGYAVLGLNDAGGGDEAPLPPTSRLRRL